MANMSSISSQFTIFKNPSADHIIYDKKSNVFYKYALPSSPPFTMSEFKSCLSNMMIMKDGELTVFYDELTESAKTTKPEIIPKNYDQPEFYLEPYNSLYSHQVNGLDHAQFLTNPATFYSLAQLSDYCSDADIGYVLTNLIKQNELRIKHENTPPLVLDSELCTLARNRLQELLVNPNSPQTTEFIEYGENLYVQESSGIFLNLEELQLQELGIEFDEDIGENKENSEKSRVSGSEVAEIWYNEIEEYDGDFSEETRNFTQMLWQDSYFVGIACGLSESGDFIAVSLYYPPGNVFDAERGLKVENRRMENPEEVDMHKKRQKEKEMERSQKELKNAEKNFETTRNGEKKVEIVEKSEIIAPEITENEFINHCISGNLSKVQELYDNQIQIGFKEFKKTSRTIKKYMQNWVNEVDKNGWSALHHAVRHDKSEITEKLIEFEADVTLPIPPNGTNVLHIATQIRQTKKPGKTQKPHILTKILDKLYELAADTEDFEAMLNTTDNRGLTPLALASYFTSDITCFKILLNYGADPRADSEKFGSVFSIACDKYALLLKNDPESESLQTKSAYDVLKLLSRYCKVDEKSDGGWTALSKAISAHRNVGLVRVLVEDLKCKVGGCLDSGESPLILACQIRKKEGLVKELVGILVKAGADVEVSYEFKGEVLTAQKWLVKRKYDIVI